MVPSGIGIVWELESFLVITVCALIVDGLGSMELLACLICLEWGGLIRDHHDAMERCF